MFSSSNDDKVRRGKKDTTALSQTYGNAPHIAPIAFLSFFFFLLFCLLNLNIILCILLYSTEKAMAPPPVLSPGKSHGQRSLVGCSPWGHKESDTTEQLHFHFSLSGIGEGNGNPLQCSCLENPRDGRAWWAAICGVAQSRTRLKWLSSSSSGYIVSFLKSFFGSW